jgi:hypothetical protein
VQCLVAARALEESAHITEYGVAVASTKEKAMVRERLEGRGTIGGRSAALVLLLALALGAAASRSALAGEGEEPSEAVNVVVQVVDDLWLPLHDASVTLSAQTRRAETYRANSDEEGYARFSVPPNVRYSIRVSLWGYREERVRSLRAWGNQKTFVQVKLRE